MSEFPIPDQYGGEHDDDRQRVAADVEAVLSTIARELAPAGGRAELYGFALVVETLSYDADGAEFTQAFRFGPDSGTVCGTQRLLRRGLDLTAAVTR